MPSKKYYWRNPDKFREQANDYRLKNPEWKKKSAREWVAKKRTANPGFEKDAQKKYRKANQKERQAATAEWVKGHPGYYMLKNAQYRAKRAGLPFSITLDDIVVPEICPVLGIKIANYKGKGRAGFKGDAPSLDKIIPAKGYVRGNICVISNRANAIKRDATLAELEAVVAYVRRETS